MNDNTVVLFFSDSNADDTPQLPKQLSAATSSVAMATSSVAMEQ
jgi:hypothetical protein